MTVQDPFSDSTSPDTGESREAMSPEDLLAALFSAFPGGFFTFSGDGAILSGNGALADMTGFSPDELCTMNADMLFRDELFRRILRSGGKKRKDTGGIRCEGVLTGKDGVETPVELTVTSAVVAGCPAGFVIVRDIAREKKEREENSALRNQLRHAQKMETVGQLAGGISHYFNNVFTGIMGSLSLAEVDATDTTAQLIRQAGNAADRARSFTRQILSLSRKSSIVPEPVDPGAIIDDVETFARLAFDRRIEITVKKPGELPGVLADAAAIHHVLLNLCVNARDAIEAKRLSTDAPSPRITIEALPVTLAGREAYDSPEAHPGRFVKISVSDNGCGMCEEVRRRLFEPFFTTKEPGRGTGLGLATARETIGQHGGWFELVSEAGKGTTFSFFLPSVTLKKKVSSDIRTVDLPRGTETILFVDDDEMVRSFGSITLERLGYEVLPASDGGETLDVYLRERERIDLVVLDLGLPVLSGREVLEKLRLMDRDVRIIISTGHDFERDRSTFEELRALDYILKPFTIVDLAVSVRNALDRRVKP